MFARSSESRAGLSLRQKASALALCALNLGLGAIVAAELSAPAGLAASPPAPLAATTSAALPSDDFSLPPLDAYKAVIERPLFARGRRPFQAQAVGEELGDVKSFVLAGVTISGAERIALVRHGTPPTISHLAQGQEIDGWTVREIADDRVVLSTRATDYTIRLYKGAAP
jgi:hypothetical protein